MTLSGESWKAVAGFEGFYEVSDMGRVRSLDRVTPASGGTRFSKGRILALHPAGKGYCYVFLKRGGKQYSCGVHRLVARAFNCPGTGPEVNHRDLDKTNNRPGNLEWVTRKGNMAHAKAAGRYELQHAGGKTLARNNPLRRVKLTPAKADEVKRLAADGAMRQREIGKLFGIGQAMVSSIHRGEAWRSTWTGPARTA
jgi:NUMOD4 motif/HNH endonuclease